MNQNDGWTPERIAGMARLKEAQDKKLAQSQQEQDGCPVCGSDVHDRDALDKAEREIERLSASLAQSEQKPVAWGVFEGNLHDVFFTEAEAVEMAQLKGAHAEVKPLYTKENT